MILHMSERFILETHVKRGGSKLSVISHHQVQPDDAHHRVETALRNCNNAPDLLSLAQNIRLGDPVLIKSPFSSTCISHPSPSPTLRHVTTLGGYLPAKFCSHASSGMSCSLFRFTYALDEEQNFACALSAQYASQFNYFHGTLKDL